MKQEQSIYDDYKKLSDEELIYRYAHRNEHASIYHLFERYGHLVFGICARYTQTVETAKQTMQTIFITLLTDLKRFNIISFKPWLYNYVKNYCEIQLNGKLDVTNNSIVLDEAEFEPIPSVESDTVLNFLVDVLDNMDVDRRHCIELFYNKKMNFKTIAEKTGFTEEEVQSLVRSAKKELKIKLLDAMRRKEV